MQICKKYWYDFPWAMEMYYEQRKREKKIVIVQKCIHIRLIITYFYNFRIIKSHV